VPERSQALRAYTPHIHVLRSVVQIRSRRICRPFSHLPSLSSRRRFRVPTARHLSAVQFLRGFVLPAIRLRHPRKGRWDCNAARKITRRPAPQANARSRSGFWWYVSSVSSPLAI